MGLKIQNPGSIIVKLVAAGMLLGALGRHPYGYYTLLRWVVCGATAYSAFEAVKVKKEGWAIMFGIIAVLFNPFVPARLDRATWSLFDCGTAILLAVSLFAVRGKEL
jgi:uncharacterized membrane protein YccC